MKKLSAIFVIPLMLLGAFLVPSMAHAGTGVVSVNGGNFVAVPSTATTVDVPVQISGSDALNGFDVQVFADPAILQAASISLSGSVMPSGSIILECVNGVLVAGATCAPQDGPGVLHLAVVTLGSLTTAPTTGVLFTIHYKITGSTVSTPISFNTGCVNTSVTGDCVTISNGTLIPVSETDQGAAFGNLIDFSMAPAFSKVSTPAGVSITDAINYASLGGFSDILAETVTASAGLTATLASGGSVSLQSPATTVSDTLTLSAAAAGDYSATVATCGTFFFPSTCHSTTVPVHVASAGFTIALSQSSVTIPRGNSDSSTKINLVGVSSFSGMVSFSSSSSVSGVTGSAPSATLTPDASGYSAATSTLTIAVSSSVATGTYTLTVTGASGSSSSMASIAVTVPGQGFSMVAVPNSITIIRGGTVAANLNIASIGNFAATITFTPSITNQGTDSCCFTNNLTPAFSPTSLSLAAGATTSVSFFASSVGGTSPASTYTATGNYTATITATGGGVTQVAVITFNIQDFAITGSFCDGSTTTNQGFIDSTVNANVGPGIVVGQPCTTITITTTSGIQDPLNGQGLFGNPTPYVLWVKTNAFGGLVTDGFDGLPSIAALNPEIPARGFTIPALSQVLSPTVDHRMCLLATYWPNGTQIPYSYLVTHGPLITPGGGFYVGLDELGVAGVSGIPWGCSFDAQTFPNDVVGLQAYNDHFMSVCDKDSLGHCTDSDKAADIAATGTFDTNECGPHEGNACPVQVRTGNADAFQVVAMTITNPTTGATLTAPGAYTFKLCGQAGVLVHCTTYGLNVIQPPQISDLHWDHSASVSHNRPIAFGVGMNNPSSIPLYFQAVISATADNGNSFTVSSAIILVAAGTNVQNTKIFSPTFVAADIGATYSFTVTILAGATPTGLTASSSDITTLFGGSGINSGSVVIKP